MGKLEKKAILSLYCGDETNTCHDRAMFFHTRRGAPSGEARHNLRPAFSRTRQGAPVRRLLLTPGMEADA